jgi:hypothetical protein
LDTTFYNWDMLTGASNVNCNPDVGQLVHHGSEGSFAIDSELQYIEISASGSADELSDGCGDWCGCAVLDLGAESETQRYEYSQ